MTLKSAAISPLDEALAKKLGLKAERRVRASELAVLVKRRSSVQILRMERSRGLR